MNTPVIFFCGVLAALLAAVLVFAGIYFTRIQTLNSIEKLTGYADGFNLYRMDVRYSYSLDDMISYGVRDNQTMINVISKAALPFFPVKIQAPEFGCTAFTLTDRNGAVHMGRNYDFRNNTSAMLVCCTPENGYKSVAYAALDNVSANVPEESIKKKLASLTAPFVCLDGMNEKGVSIAVLIVDSEPVHQSTGKPVIFTSLAVRLVLDRAATTQEAVDLLRGYDMFSAGGAITTFISPMQKATEGSSSTTVRAKPGRWWQRLSALRQTSMRFIRKRYCQTRETVYTATAGSVTMLFLMFSDSRREITPMIPCGQR